MPARIHEKKRREKRKEPGARKKRANRLHQRWDSGYAFYFLSSLLFFSVRFFFFLRDDVIARRSAGCYVREKIGAVGKREFAKGEGSFCEKKEKEKKEKSRIRWKPPPFEMNI